MLSVAVGTGSTLTHHSPSYPASLVFFFNDTETTEIYTLSLHDALPISATGGNATVHSSLTNSHRSANAQDRKSTRLNSSHVKISYAVFCLKKNNTKAVRGGEMINQLLSFARGVEGEYI